MSNYSAIKNATNAYIKTNGRQEITGDILNSVLVATIESLGKYYQFVGVAHPSTDPGSNLDQNVAYITGLSGIYTDMGGIEVFDGEVAVIKFDGSWHKEIVIKLPTALSELDNDMGYVTNAVADLLNYYKKEETFSQTEIRDILSGYYDRDEVDSIVSSIVRQSYVIAWDGASAPVVANIPSGVSVTYEGVSYVGTLVPSESTANRIYLVSDGGGGYTEYVTTQDSDYSWVLIGTTSIDLSGYATSDEVAALSGELNELHLLTEGAYREESINDFSGFAKRPRYPASGGVWVTGTTGTMYKHTLIPIKGAVAVKITAPLESYTVVAFFTNFNAPTSGSVVPFCTGTSTITIDASNSQMFEIPEDAEALYVYFGKADDGYDKTPSEVVIYHSLPVENADEIAPKTSIHKHIYTAGGYRMQSTIAGNPSYSVFFCEVKRGDRIVASVSTSGSYLSHGFTQFPPGTDISVDGYEQDPGGNRTYHYIAPYDGYFNLGGSISSTSINDISVTRDGAGFAASVVGGLKKYPIRGCNLITEASITEGVYVSGNTGVYVSSSSFIAIEVEFPADDSRIYLNRIYAGYFALFDKDGNIVVSGGNDVADRIMYSGFRLPKGVVRGRFTSQSSKATILSTGYISYYHPLTQEECDNRVDYEDSFSYDKPEEIPTEYQGRDMSSFRHIVCCGDSLTQGVFNHSSGSGPLDTSGYDYPANLAAISGRTVVNLGYGGATSASWLSRFRDDPRLSGNDCAIIQLGVNDDGSTLDTTSRTAFIGIIDRLKELNNGIKIFLAGIINGQSYRCATSDETLYTRDQWIKALYAELYANDPQVFLIDHAKYGHLRDDKAGTYGTFNDNYNMGHLSAYGYNRLAQDYYAYIGRIMKDNDQDFRAIQFIGTNYSY